MRLLLQLLFALAALAAVSGGRPRRPPFCVCPAGFQPLEKDGCFHLVADGDFDRVQVACRSRGGHLIRITDEKKDGQARGVMASHLRAMVWIGLQKNADSNDEWRWTDGSSLSVGGHGFSDWHREPGNGSCVVSWLHGGWQQRDCRLTAPGLCYHERTPRQPCAPPPAKLELGQPQQGRQSRLPGDKNKWKLPTPPPASTPHPPLQNPPQWVHREMVMRDAPAQWHQWL